MNFLKTEQISPPPGVISSLKNGFDKTANHLEIILLPVLLDIFLWLGPQLRVENLLRKLLSQFNTFAQESLVHVEDLERIRTTITELISLDINLFSLLRTLPIGVSSLMSRALTGVTPLGEATTMQIDSAFVFFLWLVALTFVGWVLGSIYFVWVAKTVFREETENAEEVHSLFETVKIISQSILLAFTWFVALFTFGVPILLVFSIFVQINAGLAQIALIFLALFAMWIIVPVFFSPHGVFVNRENLIRSIISSFHLSRFTLPTSSFFVISVFVISQGFNFLWLTPSPSSWMMLVGIIGHAFITTALLAASFIYYRDMKLWLETLLEKINSERTSAQA